jgi:hypothetical protein
MAMAQEEDVLRPQGRRANDNPVYLSSGSSAAGAMKLAIGIEGGLNFNMYSAKNTGLVADSRLAPIMEGTGLSPTLGVFADMSIDKTIGLMLSVAYDAKSAGKTMNTKADCQLDNGVITTADIQGVSSLTMQYLTTSLMARVNLSDNWFILMGPTVQFRLGDQKSGLRETALGDCLFRDEFGNPILREVNAEGVDSTAASTRLGATIAVGYKAPIAKNIDIGGRVGFQLMSTKISPDTGGVDPSRSLTLGNKPFTMTDQLLNSVQAAVMLWFHL